MTRSTPSSDGSWFDELELDPQAHPVSMSTRSLGVRPWLVVDDRRDDELAQKRASLTERRDEVAWFTDASRPAATAVTDLIATHGIELTEPTDHPLERAALSVQEDLCLLRRDRDLWVLDASVLCFPTHWTLADKVDRPIGQVHDPVGGYHERIAERVTRLFDRLTDHPVWRRNWSLTDTTELFQPRYRDGDPDVPTDRVMYELHIRSERQTLRLVAPGWILFTIRIQMASLDELLTTPARRMALRHWVEHVPADIGPKRHLGESQRRALLAALK